MQFPTNDGETIWAHGEPEIKTDLNGGLKYTITSEKWKKTEDSLTKNTSTISIDILFCNSSQFTFKDGLEKLPFDFNSFANIEEIISQRKIPTLLFNGIFLRGLRSTFEQNKLKKKKNTHQVFSTLSRLSEQFSQEERLTGIPLKKIALIQLYKIFETKTEILKGNQYPIIFNAEHITLTQQSEKKIKTLFQIQIFSESQVMLRFPDNQKTLLGKGEALTCYAVYPLAVNATILAQTIIFSFKPLSSHFQMPMKMQEAITNETFLIELQKTSNPHLPTLYSSSRHSENNNLKTIDSMLNTMELYPINLNDLSILSNLTDLQKLKISIELISAVQTLHTQKTLHRDIKPDNIFLNNDLSVILGDFGFSCSMKCSDDKSKEQAIFNYQNPVGSRAYWSPEVYLCVFKKQQSITFLDNLNEDVYSKMDIWALLCTLWEMWAGIKHPYPWLLDLAILFDKNNRNSFQKSISSFFSTICEFNKISHENSELSSIYQIFLQFLQSNPSKRPTAAELLIQFQQIQSDYPQNESFSRCLSQKFVLEVQELNLNLQIARGKTRDQLIA